MIIYHLDSSQIIGGKNRRKKMKKIIGFVISLLIVVSFASMMLTEVNHVTANSLALIQNEPFSEIEVIEDKTLLVNEMIGDTMVYYWEHVIENVTIKEDYIILHIDPQTEEIIKYEKEWTTIDLSEKNLMNDIFEPIHYFWKQKICFLDENRVSSFYDIEHKHDYPLCCWEVRHRDGSTILYDQKGDVIGIGIPAPSEGFSVSGWVMQSDPDNYKGFRENADFWFKQWTTSNIGLSLPTPSTISSYISKPTIDYFYVMAHGNQQFFQADKEGSYYYSTNLNTDMNNRDAITFAFIGTCQSMTTTGPGTFSYEFRKGKMKDTVTIGFDHMELCPGWQYEYPWQNSMFENMSKGFTIKQSFEKATAAYPTIASAVVFLGDEQLKIPQSDLEGFGEISWSDIVPKEQISDSFTIENGGDLNSALSWDIVEFPDWGSWDFSPSDGHGLTPEDDPITVEVSIIAPDEKQQSFDGQIKIVNIYDDSDYCIIPVSVTTQKNKANNAILFDFLRTIIQNHSPFFFFLEKLYQ